MANTIFTQKSTCLAEGTFGTCQASKANHPIHHLRFNSKINYNHSFSSVPKQSPGLRFQKDTTRKMNMVVYACIPPGDPLPVNPPPGGHWNGWIIGTIFTIVLSFSRGKWGPLLQLKEKIETTIDEAERVAEIVEEVAEGVEKIAEEAVEHLPKGKLRDAAEFIEKVAEDIEKHAHNAEDALEKVEDMEKELGTSFFESTTPQEKNIVPTTEAKDSLEGTTD